MLALCAVCWVCQCAFAHLLFSLLIHVAGWRLASAAPAAAGAAVAIAVLCCVVVGAAAGAVALAAALIQAQRNDMNARGEKRQSADLSASLPLACQPPAAHLASAKRANR